MYRGRFAPTPSGPLHFGSMVAAIASYVDARAHQGEWHVRIDDLDPLRVQPHAINTILACLDAFHLRWDGEIVYESQRNRAYDDALELLRAHEHVYACTCTRAQIAALGLPGIEGFRYAGTCRNAGNEITSSSTLRISVPDHAIEFDDLLQGHVRQELSQATGDFVIRRADGVFAYHLACAVDDAASGFTHVVRGADLMESTPRQIFLQRCLGFPTPHYLHLPVALDAEGHKLAKQTLAEPVDIERPLATLRAVLAFLSHAPIESDMVHHDLDTLMAWAIEHWDRAKLKALGKARSAPKFKD